MVGLLAGKVALITGGASGIGKATVERFCAEGARCVIADIQQEAGASLASELGPSAHFVTTDVTDEAAIEQAVAVTVEHFGRLDVMHNNAAAQVDVSPIVDLTGEGYEAVQRLVSRSVLLGHKYAARQFQKQGPGGCIITTASSASLQGGWGAAGYTIGKHAVLGIIKQAVAELSRFGIRTNAIAPGIVLTPIMAAAFGVPPEKEADFSAFLADQLGHLNPSGRVAQPVDIANVAVFLASDLSAHVNGATITVDGGATAMAFGDASAEGVYKAALAYTGG